MIIARKGDRGAKVKTIQRLLKIQPDGIFGTLTEEAVKTFQREQRLAADGIVGAKTWSKLLTKAMPQTKRTINEIIVHCTATRRNQPVTVDDVRRWHKEKGYADIGYHYLIYLNGEIHKGRPVEIAGAHCLNHNAHSIGVCYVGGLDLLGKDQEDTRTEQQKTALRSLLRQLKTQYPDAVIRGHRDFANKTCPSFDATREYKDI